MADVHAYRVYHDDLDIEAVLTIDHEILTEANALEINGFWTDGDSRLAACDDNARLAVAHEAGRFGIDLIARAECWDVNGLNRELYAAEGWGDYAFNGIKFVSCDGALNLEFENVICEEIDPPEVADG